MISSKIIIKTRLTALCRANRLSRISCRRPPSSLCHTLLSRPTRSSGKGCPIYLIKEIASGATSSEKHAGGQSKFIQKGTLWSWSFWVRCSSRVRSRLAESLGNCILWFDIRWTSLQRGEYPWKSEFLPSVFWANFHQSLPKCLIPAFILFQI